MSNVIYLADLNTIAIFFKINDLAHLCEDVPKFADLKQRFG